jgi:hypothetical protein
MDLQVLRRLATSPHVSYFGAKAVSGNTMVAEPPYGVQSAESVEEEKMTAMAAESGAEP